MFYTVGKPGASDGFVIFYAGNKTKVTRMTAKVSCK